MGRLMKDSGIEWCMEIPSTWQVMPNKRVMRKVKEINDTYKGEDILSLTMNGVIVRDLDAGGKMPTSFDGYQRVKKGNLLMCLFDIDVTPRCIGLINNDGLTSPAYSQFELYDNASAPYYYYYYLMLDHTKELLHLAKNLRHSFTEEQLGAISVPVPPIAEQEAIAGHLDGKCREIDSLVEIEQKMIEQLKAYRQSVITEAVTKGLNPAAPLKDSGIPWIGQVPEHWETITLRGLSKGFRKGNGITKEELDPNGDIQCVRYGDIYTKYDFLIQEVFCKTNLNKIASPVYAEYGDIFFTCSGEDVNAIGKSAAFLNKDACLVGGDLIIMKHSQNPKFLGYSLGSEMAQKQKSYGKSKLKVVHTSVKHLKDVVIALPPIEEQEMISTHLDTKCKEIQALIDIKQQKIARLKEFKKSLIYEGHRQETSSAYLTGFMYVIL